MPVSNFISKTFKDFVRSQQFSGILLLLMTAISLSIANSRFADGYHHFFEDEFHFAGFHMSHLHIINEGLMTVFFLLVGLEIKREFVRGELSGFEKASLPVAAAIGGMLVPALLYTTWNAGTSTEGGWGIPMATDIAFAIGILSLAGNKVPNSLKVLLTAIAVVDDLGAVLVIAIFYTSALNLFYGLLMMATFILLLLLNKFGVKNLIVYLLPGFALWYFTLMSGIHSTIAGVLLAITIPLTGKENSPLEKLEHALHTPVNLFVMPLFALANTIITIGGNAGEAATGKAGLGIISGLFIGKPVGIVVSILLLLKLGVSRLPEGISKKHLIGMGLLGGIGFTMSIFISLLAFKEAEMISSAKLSILIASLLSGVVGYVTLKNSRNAERR